MAIKMSDTYNYLLSNADQVERCELLYEPTWIMFVESIVETELDAALIEVYKYIDGSTGTQTKTKRVHAEEARAEWRFWIGQGFNRIIDPENKGWKYTRHLQHRAEKSSMFRNPTHVAIPEQKVAIPGQHDVSLVKTTT